MKAEYYCVVDDNDWPTVAFGIGKNRREALLDAAKTIKDYPEDNGNCKITESGDIVRCDIPEEPILPCYPCTKDAYEEIVEYGNAADIVVYGDVEHGTYVGCAE